MKDGKDIFRVRYWGKTEDCLAYVLRMALATLGVKTPYLLECLTLRPFSWQSPLDDPKQWLAPTVDPVSGLQFALGALGIKYESAPLTSFELAEWATTSAVIVGPLDRNKLWNRLPSRYHKGAAHLLLVIAVNRDGTMIVHDPEGCPYLYLSEARLMNAAHSATFMTRLVACVGPGSWGSTYLKVLRDGVQLRFRQANYARSTKTTLHDLRESFSHRTLKSSEIASLAFALPQASLSLNQLYAFLQTMPPEAAKQISRWSTHKSSLCRALRQGQFICARAMTKLYLSDQLELIPEIGNLHDTAVWLDSLFQDLYNDLTLDDQ